MTTTSVRAALAAFLLAGCAGAPPGATSETAPAADASVTEAMAPDIDPRYLIGPRGVGPVQVGRTLAKVRAELPGAAVRTEMFSGEFGEGEAVILEGETIAHVVAYPPLDDPGAEPVIENVFVSGARARTADGIGPGSLLSDAVEAWGPVDLLISEIELGEYAAFQAAPFPMSVKIGAQDEDVWRGGIYAEGEDPRAGAETSQFRDDAEIIEIAF